MITWPHFRSEPPARIRYTLVGLLCVAAPPLLAMPMHKILGWILLAIVAIGGALLHKNKFGQHLLLLAGAFGLLGIIPINTGLDYWHMVSMGTVLVATIAVPYIVTKHLHGEKVIVFPFDWRRKWRKREVAYVLFAAVASYLILPVYLHSTGSYMNWQAPLETSSIIRLFVGTNALGIWDELFFVGVCLALLRRHLPFVWANIAQAFLWTVFLYELGFRGWGTVIIFFFALSQGYIFKQSKWLLFIVAVHLTIDFMLFLVLIHLHNPEVLRWFITSPL